MKRLLGDKQFYRRVIALAVPIILQNGITNLVNVLDNVMVGRLGTMEMTGVAVANLLIMVFNMCVFGLISGAGLYGAQFFGKNDMQGVRYSFRFKILFSTGITMIVIVLFYSQSNALIGAFLKGEGAAADAAAALRYGKQYLHIMLIGLLPYAWAQSYAGTLRECRRTVLPMVSGLVAVLVDLVLNWLLIFGKLGFPRWGVCGAAAATVIARYVELAVLAVFTRIGAARNSFIRGAFRRLTVPKQLVGSMLVKSMPLMVNETFWAAGQTLVCQSYSLRGLQVVAANHITQTFSNLFQVCLIANGIAIGILLGNMLGSGQQQKAAEDSPKLIAFSVVVTSVLALFFLAFSTKIPLLYHTDENVRAIASGLLIIATATLPVDALANAAYFTLRSGGRVGLTFLLDGAYAVAVMVPVAFCLCAWTNWSIFVVYGFVRLTTLLKGVIGCIYVKKGVWIRNMVSDT